VRHRRDRVERGADAVRGRRAAADLQAVDAGEQLRAVLRGRHGEGRTAVEGHDADLHVVGQLVDEGAGPGLGGLEPARRDVRGRHRRRRVEHEHDRRPVDGRADGHGGLRERDREDDEGAEHRGSGDVPLPPGAPGRHGVQQVEAGEPQHVHLAAPLHEQVRHEQGERGRKQHEPPGGEERHGVSLGRGREGGGGCET